LQKLLSKIWLLYHILYCRQLTTLRGTTFGVDISDGNGGNDMLYFNKEELLQCVNYDCIDLDLNEDEEKQELGVTPFQGIASKMTNLTDDGKVKKRVC
jgi:hypothetical protein